MGNSSPKKKIIHNIYPKTQLQKKEMKKPYIVKACPKKVDLQLDKEYLYCTCGLSKTQPFCDGSHEGTKFKPIAFTATQSVAFLCQCKHSKNGPFCDYSHRKYGKIDF